MFVLHSSKPKSSPIDLKPQDSGRSLSKLLSILLPTHDEALSNGYEMIGDNSRGIIVI